MNLERSLSKLINEGRNLGEGPEDIRRKKAIVSHLRDLIPALDDVLTERGMVDVSVVREA